MKPVAEILSQKEYSIKDLVALLSAKGNDRILLFDRAREVRQAIVGHKVYLRGLVEFSNICRKDCLYCGIRQSNSKVHRYIIPDREILDACRYAWENQFGSVVLQSGEQCSRVFIRSVDNLIKKIKQLSNNELGITLSCGEQTAETYRRWYESGAHRYLIRIESSNSVLYSRIHPHDKNHLYERRTEALQNLKEIGYQTGTGVMIGLPFQTIEDLATDLMFFKNIDIDMCGMGPYIEHEDTPLYQFKHLVPGKNERFDLSLKMIAVLRLIMPAINIAATTALRTLHPEGREKGILAGANVLMPDLTPSKYYKDYELYEGKFCIDEPVDICLNKLKRHLEPSGIEIGFGEWGDSIHFRTKSIKQ